MTDEIEARLEELDRQIKALDQEPIKGENELVKLQRELEEHNNKTRPSDLNSDEWRRWDNERIDIVNKIREKINLSPLKKHRLDAEIETTMEIGATDDLIESEMEVDESGKKIKTLESMQMKDRVEGIKFKTRLKEGMEQKKVELIEKMVRMYEKVKDDIPAVASPMNMILPDKPQQPIKLACW